MALGGSAPSPPAPQPQTPVPQEDDIKGVEAQRKTAIAAKGREGYSAHLLSGSSSDTTMGEETKPKTASLME
jgi:hypothetical protein